MQALSSFENWQKYNKSTLQAIDTRIQSIYRVYIKINKKHRFTKNTNKEDKASCPTQTWCVSKTIILHPKNLYISIMYMPQLISLFHNHSVLNNLFNMIYISII